MASQVFNFLWLNLDIPPKPDPGDGTIREPLPLKYIANARKAALENPATDILLWVDSKRLTEKQFFFLQESLSEDIPNIHLKDLRSIPGYAREALYDMPETNPNWRNGGQTSVIWRQVDAAKVLISLQGDYDQSFFADLDHAHLGINSKQVQDMLDKRGLMIGSAGEGYHSVENQLWGFNRSRREFFETYYVTALKDAYSGRNAWNSLVSKVDKELLKRERLSIEEVVLPIGGDGTSAEQTGHEFRDGYGKSKASVVEKDELARLFNARSARPARPEFELTTVWAPSVQVNPDRNPVTSVISKVKRALNSVFALG